MGTGLDLARWILEERLADGPSSRAAALLLRQHLEATVARHRQLLVGLPCGVASDDCLAVEAREAWTRLRRACVGGCDRPPSRQQLIEWAEVIVRLDVGPEADGSPSGRYRPGESVEACKSPLTHAGTPLSIGSD